VSLITVSVHEYHCHRGTEASVASLACYPLMNLCIPVAGLYPAIQGDRVPGLLPTAGDEAAFLRPSEPPQRVLRTDPPTASSPDTPIATFYCHVLLPPSIATFYCHLLLQRSFRRFKLTPATHYHRASTRLGLTSSHRRPKINAPSSFQSLTTHFYYLMAVIAGRVTILKFDAFLSR
jgi:hypothetical protein